MSGGYLPVLAINAAVEAAAVATLAALVVLLRRGGRATLRPPGLLRLAALALAVNLITHPIFWFGVPHLPLAYGSRLLLAELLVVVVEGAAYAGLGRVRPVVLAFALSAAANALTWFGSVWLFG